MITRIWCRAGPGPVVEELFSATWASPPVYVLPAQGPNEAHTLVRQPVHVLGSAGGCGRGERRKPGRPSRTGRREGPLGTGVRRGRWEACSSPYLAQHEDADFSPSTWRIGNAGVSVSDAVRPAQLTKFGATRRVQKSSNVPGYLSSQPVWSGEDAAVALAGQARPGMAMFGSWR